MATGILGTLKFTTAKKPAQLSPVQNRRAKLCKKLDEQIALVMGKKNGTIYTINKIVTFVNDKGEEEVTEVAKRLREWFFMTDNGKYALTVRYGARTLELAKGKSAIEVATLEELVTALETVKAATQAGELDVAIEAVSSKLRDGFTTH